MWPSKTLMLLLSFVLIVSKNVFSQNSPQGRLAPMYSHFYLNKDGKEYSVWIVRPTLWLPTSWSQSDVPLNAFLKDPEIPYDSSLKHMFGEIQPEDPAQFWKVREVESFELLKILREKNKEEYTKQGYYNTPEKAAKQEAVFDSIFDGKSSFVAITEKDNPSHVYQQMAIVPDKGKGIPLDSELEAVGKDPLKSSRVAPRDFNEFSFAKEGTNQGSLKPSLASKESVSDLRLKRTWVSGAKVEVKALLKSKDSPEDFTSSLFKQCISHDLLKNSGISIPPHFHPDNYNNKMPSHEFIAFYEWSGKPLFYLNTNSVPETFFGFNFVNSAGWMLEPRWATTVRNTEVYLSAHSEGLKRLYEQGLGFDENLTRVLKNHEGNPTYILQASAANIEEIAWQKAKSRVQQKNSLEILSASKKNIHGQEVGFVRLETYGEGHRRRLLKHLAPDQKKLIDNYLPVFDAAIKARKDYIKMGQPATGFAQHDEFKKWQMRFRGELISPKRLGEMSCGEAFKLLGEQGTSSVFDTPYEAFQFSHKLDVLW